ncbi:MAG: ribosome-associated heat shock protein Hsp15 [Succinivibrio sp.]|nr:ribosome-associated heat shock protein Hsp15 [Succinivibrio sp.]
MATEQEATPKVRLDKWLWAARFYKTRSIARTMIEGGKVDYNGTKAKPAHTVEIGAKIKLLQGNLRKEVVVVKISEVRGPAAVAQQLYAETEESVKYREKFLEQQKINALFAPHPKDKPNKKERRALLNIKQGF